MMFPVRRSDPFETGDLNVFVPGLMAAGILMSMGMLIVDGVKRVAPTRGQRARAAALARSVGGRVRDLESVGLGTAPVPVKVVRTPRDFFPSLFISLASLVIAIGLIRTTIGAYTARTGSLADRGWTLTGGFGLALPFIVLAALALALAASHRRSRPQWLRAAAEHWPLGHLPDSSRPMT